MRVFDGRIDFIATQCPQEFRNVEREELVFGECPYELSSLSAPFEAGFLLAGMSASVGSVLSTASPT